MADVVYKQAQEWVAALREHRPVSNADDAMRLQIGFCDRDGGKHIIGLSDLKASMGALSPEDRAHIKTPEGRLRLCQEG
jgi:hypothetical protein